MTSDLTSRDPSDDAVFSCRIDDLEEDGTLIRPSGELDVHTCPAFQSVMEHATEYRRIVIDLSDVSFMDSTALSVLLVLQRRRSRPLEVVVPQQHLRKLLLITGLDTVFTVHTSLSQAMRDAA